MNTQRTPGKTRQMFPLHRLSPNIRKDVPLAVDWEENKQTNKNKQKKNQLCCNGRTKSSKVLANFATQFGSGRVILYPHLANPENETQLACSKFIA